MSKRRIVISGQNNSNKFLGKGTNGTEVIYDENSRKIPTNHVERKGVFFIKDAEKNRTVHLKGATLIIKRKYPVVNDSKPGVNKPQSLDKVPEEKKLDKKQAILKTFLKKIKNQEVKDIPIINKDKPKETSDVKKDVKEDIPTEEIIETKEVKPKDIKKEEELFPTEEISKMETTKTNDDLFGVEPVDSIIKDDLRNLFTVTKEQLKQIDKKDLIKIFETIKKDKREKETPLEMRKTIRQKLKGMPTKDKQEICKMVKESIGRIEIDEVMD